ncbi:MAG: amidohydrolase [Nocardioidaceae bacterium]
MPAGDVIPDLLDPFAGLAAEVPGALADHLRTVRLVDHHVHGVFAQPVDRATFEASINEGSTDPVPDWMSMFDGPLGVALRRWCAPLLGLAPHASGDDYWAARAALEPAELAERFLGRAGAARWVVDTGFQGSLITPPDLLTEFSGGVPSSEILRLELQLETLLSDGVPPADLPDAFRARIAQLRPHVVGTKTIAAYRCGFDIDWARPEDAAVVSSARELLDRPGPVRVDTATLSAFAVHEAAAAGLPIQVHVGFGDRDLDLHRADPLLLLPLLRTMEPVPVLLLHCYPFHRNAGYLAQAFDHVSFDVGLAVNYLGSRSVELVGEAMEVAPFTKQLYSSDAYGPPELHFLGSLLWRRAMGLVLGAWVRRGEWSIQDATRAVDLIGVENAARVYEL